MKSYSGTKIREIIRSELKNVNLQIPDMTYAMVKPDWLVNTMYPNMFRRWLRENGLELWLSYWDCDNFSILFFIFVQICNAKTMSARLDGDTVQGTAVGIMFFDQTDVGGHAINFIVTKNGLLFFEPQNGKIISLTQKEKDSSWFALC